MSVCSPFSKVERVRGMSLRDLRSACGLDYDELRVSFRHQPKKKPKTSLDSFFGAGEGN